MGAASGNVQNFGLYENIVVCGGSDGTIQVWDIEEKVLAKTLWQLEGRKIFALKCGPRIVVAWSCTQVYNPYNFFFIALKLISFAEFFGWQIYILASASKLNWNLDGP